MENGHDSRAIANEIIRIGNEKGIAISMMKLIKLVFFAHGWSLGIYGKPLSRDAAEAWQYGPVFRNLYQSLPYSGATKITAPIKGIFDDSAISSNFSKEEKELIEKVVDGYGPLGAFTLSDMTHEDGSPWDVTRRSKGLHQEIDNDLIRNYFEKKNKA